MSRIGKKPIAIPKGVKVDVRPGAVEIQGPKGKLLQALPERSRDDVLAVRTFRLGRETDVHLAFVYRARRAAITEAVAELLLPQ